MIDTDVAIVGAGPAGLSAALYAARFCRSTLVLHDGSARAARIPRTRNVPGFAAGITGPSLISRMSRHAAKYGAQIVEAHVSGVPRTARGGFELWSKDGTCYSARALILATGLECKSIPLDDRLHARAIKRGLLRYCPVCDGYEHRGERIGVVGCDVSGASEALFLRQFSSRVHLLTQCSAELTDQQRDDLAQAGIRTVTDPVAGYELAGKKMRLRFKGGHPPLVFDVIYAALGTRPRHALAVSLGIPLTNDGKVSAHAPFGTNVEGVFCAGDLVEGLDQISVAMGQGAVAATRAHNWLRAQEAQTAEAVLS
jgi:thioredoxin reductase (NADPH)